MELQGRQGAVCDYLKTEPCACVPMLNQKQTQRQYEFIFHLGLFARTATSSSDHPLSTVRDLRSLGLPGAVLRKIRIATDGKPDLSRLSDDEFNDLAREVRRVFPLVDPAQGGWASVQGEG